MAGPAGSASGYSSIKSAATGLRSLQAGEGAATLGVVRVDDRYYGVNLLAQPSNEKRPLWAPLKLSDTATFESDSGNYYDKSEVLALVSPTRVMLANKAAGHQTALDLRFALRAFGDDVRVVQQAPDRVKVFFQSAADASLARAAFAEERDLIRVDVAGPKGVDLPKPTGVALEKFLSKLRNVDYVDADNRRALPSEDNRWLVAGGPTPEQFHSRYNGLFQSGITVDEP